MMNGRPLGVRKTVQLMVLLTLLAWATQTLLHQWGYGAVLSAPAEPTEKFVPGTSRYAAGAALELRSEATVVGAEVKLRQIARWSDADKAVFAPIADLAIARLGASNAYRVIGMMELRGLLADAGVNLAVIRFAGATSCTVRRSDVQFDEGEALRQWIAAREAGGTTAPPAAASPATAPTTAAVAAEESRSLRRMLLDDLATRLNLPADQLQIAFNPKDEKALNLCEPHFRFHISPRNGRALGEVSWDVLIVTDSGNQKLTVAATARAWQQQVVLTRPVAHRQVIREEDLAARRTLVDRVGDEPLLKIEQAVGQQAAMDLRPGMLLTSRAIEAVPLARTGQLITVNLTSGNVRIKTVARAMESGSYGQTIKVKNELTGSTYEVVLTGPQTGQMDPITPETPAGSADASSASRAPGETLAAGN